jgi:hypothetical protein
MTKSTGKQEHRTICSLETITKLVTKSKIENLCLDALKGPTENELVKYNHVVFQSGENALQV